MHYGPKHLIHKPFCVLLIIVFINLNISCLLSAATYPVSYKLTPQSIFEEFIDISRDHSAVVCTEDKLKLLESNGHFTKVATTKTSNFIFVSFRYSNNPDSYLYAIIPLFAKKDLWRDMFWLQRKEIHDFFRELNVEISAGQLIQLASRACILVNGIDKGLTGYLDTCLDLSQAKFNERAQQYESGKNYSPEQNRLDHPGYSHNELFSWIYYLESQILAGIAARNPKQTTVLELGSAFGNPIFTKAELLKGKNISYLGVDKQKTIVNAAGRYAARKGLDNAEFAVTDLTQDGWRDSILAKNDGERFDFVASSHLLEHLSADPLENILAWLSVTKRVLIVSVPLEKQASGVSDHVTTFNPTILRGLANRIAEKTNNRFLVDCSQIDSGVLIIRSIEEAIAAYESLLPADQVQLRFALGEMLVYSYFDKTAEVVSAVETVIDCKRNGLEAVTAAVILRELLLQPMASSWWLMRNLKTKHGIEITVPELTGYYESFQNNRVIQDIIRFNSSASKVVALARGVLLKKKSTTYYFDVQTTDACPCKCRKCWRWYINEQGKPALLPRHAPPGLAKPGYEDFRRVLHQAIDMGVGSITSTGGGEPFMNRRLPELLADAKAYAREQGRELRVFVPSSGLGIVYRDEAKLRLIVENVDLLRFSFDSFDADFLMQSHGIKMKQYNEMLGNIKRVAALRDEAGSKIDIEVLILMYGNSYEHAEKTVETAKKLGATRVLFNSITGNDDVKPDAEEVAAGAEVIRRIYERAARGEFLPMQIDFDPVLLGGYSQMPLVDADNMERPLGNIRYCMKNVFGLTPVITADGTFHVCFPCSQPNIANEEQIFKIGNIMESSLQELVDKMRAEYRDIDPEKDCIHDCRDIPYFNGVLRKVIDDLALGIPVTAQPFLDRTMQAATFHHSMHDERILEEEEIEAVQEIAEATESVQNDQRADFEKFIEAIENGRLPIDYTALTENNPAQLLSRYETGNIFDIHIIKIDSGYFIFSYDLGLIYSPARKEYNRLKKDLTKLPPATQRFFARLLEMKEAGSIFFLDNIPLGSTTFRTEVSAPEESPLSVSL